MNIKHIVTLSIILMICYLGYTIQSQKGAYTVAVEELPESDKNKVKNSEEIENFIEEYSSFFKSQFDSLKTVGGALTIVYKGDVVYCEPYGLKKANTRDSVDIHTIFRLASVSKGFAGVLASKMAQREAISLDTPIIAYLPSLRLSKTYNQEHVTLRHVLSHSSGLLGYSFDPYVESGLSFNQIYKKLYVAKIDANPGVHYAYQNVMFSLVDTVLQLQTGMSYENLMSENVFTPLGMKDATVGFDGFVSSRNYAYPHRMISAKTLQYRVCNLNDRYYVTAPAAGVNISIADLGTWLSAIMGYSPEVISNSVIEEIGKPYVAIPSNQYKKYWGNNLTNKAYGLGWRVFSFNGDKLLYHGGYVQGYRAEVIVWPEKHIAMGMLQNSPNILAQKAVPTFVKMYSQYLNVIAADTTYSANFNRNF